MDEQIPIGLEAVLLMRGLPDAAGSLLHVTSGERRAEALARFLASALPERAVRLFPPWDCLPFDSASPSPEVMGRRMRVLHELAHGAEGTLVVASLGAVLQRVPPPGAMRSFRIRVGERLDAEALQNFCLGAGYRSDGRIDEPGEIAVRGTTIEIFPAGHELPCRIETAGDIVDSLRSFDPVSQRSLDERTGLELLPVTELPSVGEAHERGAEHRLPEAWPHLATLAAHMGQPRITASAAAAAGVRGRLARIAEAHSDAEEGGARPLAPDRLYLDLREWEALAAVPLEEPAAASVPSIAAERRPRDRLARFLTKQNEAGRRVLFCAGSATEGGRIARMVRRAGGAEPAEVPNWAAFRDSDSPLALLVATLDRGFVSGDLAVIAAPDLLGRRAGQSADVAPGLPPTLLDPSAFALGDIVVHEEHGLARLDGLEPIEDAGTEMIRLVFAGDQRLLVPVKEAGRIWRYGSDTGEVALDRLGSGVWRRRRAELVRTLEALGAELARLAAERARARAPSYEPPQAAYERLSARFPHPLTADQEAAVRAALTDIGSGRPMDRLVIGDVGFGKTEVALRAAAAVALSGAQVAVACPTTVLARQHYQSFRRRFAGFGIEVGHLSRLVTGKAAAAVREGLADGRIRIVVGTHALVGKGVTFAEPGLLVIDEEQRFGAEHKRRLRDLGRGLHVLSMSATPIPRTLQAALAGLQDLSVIATPPARRRPIRTLLAEASPATIRQALVREHRRGGQSFVVVPRVEDIADTADRLRDLVPEMVLRIAHGGLPAREIDETMVAFAAGDGDVLLATSIIESGLDVARANTMLVLRPELFGLAQLHQLRGRVGRGALQGYCYLMDEAGEEPGEEARKRFAILQSLDRLGAGMAISAADLDQRGAGDLLGTKQAGHVRRVGLGLYQEMLAQALRQARGDPPAPPPVELQGETGHIPADHVPEPELRIELYHRIARVADPGEAESLAEEVADRFGPPPPPLQALLTEARLRALAALLGVERASLGPEGVALVFREGIDPAAEFGEAARRDGLELEGRQLVLRRPTPGAAERLQLAADLLEGLA
ncbi:DEAD/DEAH box helicase [Cereibacter sediminicola]|uniref:DEAD/DEAH box helicase n=1 Tax=Cereibacter sediminicola TaxID=2584941 RepID=UPI0011A978EB|nr:DEAD/DEAH box helicase [Cereibacter sediminicola]